MPADYFDLLRRADVLRQARHNLDALERVVSWEDDSVEFHIAADPATTPEALRFLATHCVDGPEVMSEIVDNPNTPGDALATIVDRLIEYYGTVELAETPICRALAACPDLPMEARTRLPEPS